MNRALSSGPCNSAPRKASIRRNSEGWKVMASATRGSGLGKILALGTVGALFWFTRKSAPQAAKDERHSAAFADGETQSENFDTTRSAGPDGMRATVKRPWESVDQDRERGV